MRASATCEEAVSRYPGAMGCGESNRAMPDEYPRKRLAIERIK
jgi:hypothetical protein